MPNAERVLSKKRKNPLLNNFSAKICVPSRPHSLAKVRISADAPDDVHNEAVTLTKEAVPAIARASERLEDTAPLLAMPENKADNQQITASELAAVRCIVETCAVDLDRAWERV